MRIVYLLIFSLLIPVLAFSQKKTRIELVNADEWSYDKNVGKDITIIRGNAIFKHDSAYLYCDSAYLNDKKNNLDAFSNVHLIDNDTTHLYGDVLHYNGDTRMAIVEKNVKLQDPTTEVYTDKLFYDRNTNSAYYNSGGEIFNGDNTLTSIIGNYFSDKKQFFFKDSVVLINPDYRITSDTLEYNTDTEVVYFHGSTNIYGEQNHMFCKNGFYDTKMGIAQFNKDIVIYYDEQILKADSIYYEEELEFGQAFRNVVIIDTVQRMQVDGNYAEYHKKEGFSFVTDSAVAMMYEDSDTLYLHADTLVTYFNDSTRSAEQLLAYYKAKFYRNDLQGMSDSIAYNFKDSTVTLFYDPILWSEQNQLTADTIFIVSSNQQIQTLRLANAAFIISLDDTLQYNQVKGRDMVAYFTNNELRKVIVKGNSQTIYYLRDEDKSLIGINKAESSNMNIWIEDNKIQKIAYLDNPHAPLYPPNKLAKTEQILKDFLWKDNERPKNRHQILLWSSPTKGITKTPADTTSSINDSLPFPKKNLPILQDSIHNTTSSETAPNIKER